MMKIRIGMPLASIGAGLVLSFAATDASANGEHLTIGGWKSWGGTYFGTYFGAGSGNTDQSFHDRSFQKHVAVNSLGQFTDIDSEYVFGSGHLNGHATGSKADLFVGYTFHPECANFLFGAQLEGTIFSDITLKETGTRNEISKNQDLDFSGGVVSDIESNTASARETAESTDDLRSMFSLVARAGFLITPETLIYGLIGATEGHFVVPDNDDPFGGRRSKWELGYTVGAGLEYMFNDNWSIRAEYRFIHFDVDRNQNSFSNITSATATSIDTTRSSFHRGSSTDVDFNVGQIGVVYRFPC